MKLCDEEWLPLSDKGFVLLEPLNRPHFIDDAVLTGTPCTPYGLEKIEHLMPRLVDLQTISESDRELLQELYSDELKQVRPPFVCAWIESEMNADELTSFLAQVLVGTGNRRRLIWRFYDPRVLSLAYGVLNLKQRKVLFQDIKCWVFPWSTRWWSIELEVVGSHSSKSEGELWPDSGQWAILANSDLVHRTRSEVCAVRGLEAKDAPRIVRDIVNGMREAEANLKLSDSVQQSEYARLIVLFGDAFRFHSVLESLRPGLINGRLKWADFRDSVSEEELNRLTEGVRVHQSTTPSIAK
jgi:hypothetical protein